MTTTSVTSNIQKKLAKKICKKHKLWQTYQFLAKTPTKIINNNIPHTPTKVGVIVRKTFSHTPDEAMSGGLAKACDPWKNLFCWREIKLLHWKLNRMRSLHAFVCLVLALKLSPVFHLSGLSLVCLLWHHVSCPVAHPVLCPAMSSISVALVIWSWGGALALWLYCHPNPHWTSLMGLWRDVGHQICSTCTLLKFLCNISWGRA